MKTLHTVILLASLGALGARSVAAQSGAWAVVSKRPLGPRITSQIQALAQKRGVALHMMQNPRQAKASQPNLLIQIQPLKRDSQLLKMLQRQDPGATTLNPETARQGYVLDILYGKQGEPAQVRITASEPAGLHNALLRIPELAGTSAGALADAFEPKAKHVASLKGGREVRVADFPSFRQRGVVEGFYGPPWSLTDRLDVLRFEGDHAMNIYFYAPKDDPYHRDKWREPYPAALRQQLEQEVQAAHANFVDFCFAISPGLSMTYSNDSDFADLTAKLDSVQKMGVSCFALFLDDIPQQLQNPADQARFKDLGTAHAYLINKLNRYLKRQSPRNRLVVTPTTYTNAWGSRTYVKELGKEVDSDVPIAWTGTQVVSPVITLAQAQRWEKLLRRKLVIWDNFPVNDGIPWRLILAPVTGRDPGLPEVVEGLYSNPMIQAHASLIALQTVADYLWAPKSYDPRLALQDAVVSQYGKGGLDLLGPFLKTYGDYWWDQNVFTPLYIEQRQPIGIPQMEATIGALKQALAAITPLSQFAKLVPEISPFPAQSEARLEQVKADPAFKALLDGKIVWNADDDVLRAFRVAQPPKLDGDFEKWEQGPVYVFENAGQIAYGSEHWKGPDQFSAQVALRWDPQYLYIGIRVNDPNFYYPANGVAAGTANSLRVILDTAFRKDYLSTKAGPDDREITFTPGDFAQVPAKATIQPRLVQTAPVGQNFPLQVKAVWKKTVGGYSADFAIAAAYFCGHALQADGEMGMALLLGKLVQPAASGGAPQEAGRIVFTSKADALFPVRFRNPATYQRLILTAP
jgi:hypothetical protein